MRIDDRGLLVIAGIVCMAVAVGVWWQHNAIVRDAERALRAVAVVPDSARIESYERRDGRLCGTWSGNNAMGQRLQPMKFFYRGGNIHIEPDRYDDDDLLRSMFMTVWRSCSE